MADYVLTPRALADLDDIAEYTLERWGRAQAEKYLSALTKRMEWLAASPNLGANRDEIAQGYRCFPEGNHLVFYIIKHDMIQIIGVPHKSMDIDVHLA